MSRFSSLRSRAIILVLLAILPLLALTVYSYFNQRDEAIRERQRDELVAVRNLATAQEIIISNTRNLLTILSRLPDVQRLDPEACNALFAELLKQTPFLATIGATDSEGRLFASAPAAPGPVTFGDRTWFQKVKQTRDLVLGETVVGRISGKYGNNLAYPILDREGRFIGTLTAQFNLNWLPNLLAKSALPPTAAIVLTDTFHKVLWRYPEPEKYLGYMLPEAFLKPMGISDEGIAEGIGLPGDPRLFAFARLSPPWQDLWMTIGLPREWAISPVNRILARNLIFLGLVALLSMAAAWYGGEFFIVRPVMKLRTVAERLTSGDLSVRAGPEYQLGEMGLLAHSFDQMADSLQERQEALRRLNAGLGVEVQKRTKELRLAVAQLEEEVAERRQAEDRAITMGRLYQVLSKINEAIVRAPDQETLFQQACRIAVEEGLFRMAWIGLIDPVDRSLKASAQYGFENGYLETLVIPIEDVPEGQGPTGVAVREGGIDVCNDFEHDPRMAPWRDRALARGYCSSAALPLRKGREVVGAMTLYADRPGFFTTEEITLLEGMAADLSFSLESLDREVKRRRAEEALAEHAALVQDLYNNAPCGYHSLDQEGRIVQINDTELAWLGYSREEVVGRLKFTDLITSQGLKVFQESFPGFKASGLIRDLEYEMIRKDGTVFPVALSATVVTDEAGDYLMSRATIFDITDRKQAEKALAAERQRLFALLEQIPAYVILLAPDYTVPFVNREFIRRFGKAGEGQTCYEFLFGRDESCPDCRTFKVLENNQPQEWQWLGPDGRTYAVYGYPFTDADGSSLILEMGLDITDRQRAEEALKRSEEKLRYLAEQLLITQENERKRLAAELHDELGHALLALKLHLSPIEKKMLPEQQDLKEEIRAQLDYINGVIQNVRRLYHDLSPGDLEDIGLTKALHTLINEFAGLFPQISWQVDLAELEGLFSLPVQTTIYRIVQEALTNIGKHADPTAVTISCTRDGHQVNFIIQDNGQGFDMAQVLDSSQAGRGVGLVAMEERLNMVRGSFDIQSRENEGTRISFTIPTLPAGEKP